MQPALVARGDPPVQSLTLGADGGIVFMDCLIPRSQYPGTLETM